MARQREILYSLIGFTGGIVNASYNIENGIDDLNLSERDEIAEILPLGLLYARLKDYTQQHDIRWGIGSSQRNASNADINNYKNDGNSFSKYKGALCLGLQDILNSYVSDVNYLESVLVRESEDQILPYTHIIQHLRTYLIVFPVLHEIITSIEQNGWHGCKILNYIAHYHSGAPMINDAIARILIKLRVVFFKQCFAWMVYGNLNDPAEEFFIIPKTKINNSSTQKSGKSTQSKSSMMESVLNRLEQSRLITKSPVPIANPSSFEWANSYILKLDLVPDSHVTPRMASKIMFCGKAINLIRFAETHPTSSSAHPSAQKSSTSSHELFKYFTSSTLFTQNWEVMNQTNQSDPVHPATYGLTSTEIETFQAAFQNILNEPHKTFELFELIVDQMNQIISKQLWTLFRHQFQFILYLEVIRNVFLLGKGEFFQFILNQMLLQSYHAIQEVREMDHILNWDILSNTLRSITSHEEALMDSSLISFHIITSNVSYPIRMSKGHHVTAALPSHPHHSHHAMGDIQLVGSAKFISDDSLSSAFDHISLCPNFKMNSNETFRKLWYDHLLKKKSTARQDRSGLSVDHPDSLDQVNYVMDGFSSQSEDASTLDVLARYSFGAVVINEAKYMTKGFNASATFRMNWNSVIGHVGKTHPLFNGSKRSMDLMLGSFQFSFHSDKRSNATMGSFFRFNSDAEDVLYSNIVGSLNIGVSIHAKYSDKKPSYYAKLFIKNTNTDSVSFGTSSYSKYFHSQEKGSKEFRHDNIRYVVYNEEGSHEIASCLFDIDRDGSDTLSSLSTSSTSSTIRGNNQTKRSLNSMESYRVEVLYCREVVLNSHNDILSQTSLTSSTLHTTSKTVHSSFSTTARGSNSSVVYKLKLRLRSHRDVEVTLNSMKVMEDSDVGDPQNSHWDIDIPFDLQSYVSCMGSQANVGIQGLGMVLNPEYYQKRKDDLSWEDLMTFNIELEAFQFNGKIPINSYPAGSTYTSTRYPDSYIRLEEEINKMKAWMNIGIRLTIPMPLQVIYDVESMASYERIFTLLMKVRFISLALEKLWMERGSVSTQQRIFCHLRHSMHFFTINWLYFIQVDVIDSEYNTLRQDINQADDFQSILKIHKNFIANIMRISLIDNQTIQESMDRILHICLRFIVASRIVDNSLSTSYDEVVHPISTSSSSSLPTSSLSIPIYIPPEEIISIRKDFYHNVSYLFQLLKKIDTKGFLFRLDFNGFLSNPSDEVN